MPTPPSAKIAQAPWPGSHAMPQWDVGELIDAPRFRVKNLWMMIGPGLVMGAAAIGGGEWLTGPAVTARYGPALLWIATVSIIFQVIYNIEISRYTLYTGEPIFTGKLRIPPGPWFWVVAYLLLDWGSITPYLAANAAVPIATLILGRLPNADQFAGDWWLLKVVGSALFLLTLVPLVFGGKIYNSLKVVMSAKLVIVVGFLLFLGLFFTQVSTWGEIASGLFNFGSVPVVRGEDVNGNGVLDPGEDFDGDGRLDGIEEEFEDENGVKQFTDVDGDGIRDGVNVDNYLVALWKRWRDGRALPDIDWSLIGVIAALAAIAGNGGLTNTPISNFTRDQGWGMGHQVGAIPSIVGGQGVTLSHVGCVFPVNEETLPRWRRWVRHITRDQLLIWLGACLIGVSLPSILSVEFLPRGTEASSWSGAAMTAAGVEEHVTSPQDDVLASRLGLRGVISGPNWGRAMWSCTLLCGFLVLITSQIMTTDGFVRRWVDVFWTASGRMRKKPTDYIRIFYFRVLMVYAAFCLTMLWIIPDPKLILQLSTTAYNFAFAFSAWHTALINTILLPRELRPSKIRRIGLGAAGCFFTFLGVMSCLQLMGRI